MKERVVPDPISGQGVGAKPKKQPYTLYTAGGRVYAQNAAYNIIAERLHFLWLDGQFTALADVRHEVDLSQATRLKFALDELGPNTPAQSAVA